MMNLINPRRRMKESMVFLVFAVAGSCAGIFWTNSKDNDYPRIGRRSFYTSSSENSYPRIGRSGNMDTFRDKRPSFFTQSEENTFPRIGRSDFHKQRAENAEDGKADGHANPDATFPSSSEVAPALRKHVGSTFGFPAPILFFAWDSNGDDSLSREEFVKGISNARKRRSLV